MLQGDISLLLTLFFPSVRQGLCAILSRRAMLCVSDMKSKTHVGFDASAWSVCSFSPPSTSMVQYTMRLGANDFKPWTSMMTTCGQRKAVWEENLPSDLTGCWSHGSGRVRVLPVLLGKQGTRETCKEIGRPALAPLWWARVQCAEQQTDLPPLEVTASLSCCFPLEGFSWSKAFLTSHCKDESFHSYTRYAAFSNREVQGFVIVLCSSVQ